MNQTKSLKRTAISFGLALTVAIVALSIQKMQSNESTKLEAEANIFPERMEHHQK
jgi:hypothetical protein